MSEKFCIKSLINTAFLVFIFLVSPGLRAGDELEKPSDVFRNIFYTLAKEKYADEDIQRLIFVPSEKFLNDDTPMGTDREAFDGRVNDWNSIKPIDLYTKGQNTAFVTRDLAPLHADLAKSPVTILIIPGIFGEFIEHTPFEEVLTQKDSRFAKDFTAALEKNPVRDEVFDLETLAQKEVDLKEVLSFASLDNAEGKDMIRVIYLKPLFGSLETLGTLEDSALVYQRRLNKLKDILGKLENLYIMGYSRGLNVALELSDQAAKDPEAHPWFKDLKGIISLGGTLYGSPLADGAFIPGKPTCAALDRLNQLARELVTLPADADLGEKIKAVATNAAAWTSAGADLVKIGASMEVPEGLVLENIPTDEANLGAFGKLFKTVILEKFKITVGSEFNNNVEKFQYLMKEVTEGARSITLDSSLEWQRHHLLPAHLKYFTLQGTMGDPTTQENPPGPLTEDSVSFNTKTLDYRALRASYYDYWQTTGTSFNDSQASPDRTVFWSKFHQSLNPEQKPYEAHLLAILGVDHWGMSFPVALESRNGEESPYPRTLLLHTLGAFLATDSQTR